MDKKKYEDYIKNMEEEELKNQILELIELIPSAREYYDLRINPKLERKMLEEYKNIIKKEFFPHKEEVKMRYSVVSEAIIEFQRKALTPNSSVELMLYYVEVALDFTNMYGYIGEKFYISVEGTFNKALNYAFKNEIEDEFYLKCKEIVERSSDVNEDFQESINEIFDKYFE